MFLILRCSSKQYTNPNRILVVRIISGKSSVKTKNQNLPIESSSCLFRSTSEVYCLFCSTFSGINYTLIHNTGPADYWRRKALPREPSPWGRPSWGRGPSAEPGSPLIEPSRPPGLPRWGSRRPDRLSPTASSGALVFLEASFRNQGRSPGVTPSARSSSGRTARGRGFIT